MKWQHNIQDKTSHTHALDNKQYQFWKEGFNWYSNDDHMYWVTQTRRIVQGGLACFYIYCVVSGDLNMMFVR